MDDEMRAKRAYAGRLGALANLARYGSKAVGRRRYEGRRRNIAARLDPDGLLTTIERERRVDYVIAAQLARATEERRRRRAREREYGRTEEEMNAAIAFIAQPPVFCIHCIPRAEWPENGSGGICTDCAAKPLRTHAA